MRNAVISLLAQCEDPAILQEGNLRFQRVFIDGDEKAVAPDLRATVYKIVCFHLCYYCLVFNDV